VTFLKNNKVFIIAEAGSNHNGSIEKGKLLIDIAADAGADAVKFQSFSSENLLIPTDPDYELLSSIELPHEFHDLLNEYSDKRGIIFCSTPFDFKSADTLDRLGVPFFKVASGDITYSQFLKHIARKGKPIILSTGKSDLEDIDRALKWINEEGCEEVILLHCVAQYPAKPQELNLRVLPLLKERYGIPVGLSDHTEEFYIPAMAVTLGATVIEKHFTYDKKAKGPDHGYAVEPHELKQMVKAIRDAESSMGDGLKIPSPSEMNYLKTGRRGLFAAKNLKKGETLEVDDVMIVRPQAGLPAYKLDDYLGRQLKENVNQHSPILSEHFG